MNVFRLRVSLEWEEFVWRIIEIRGDQTLHDLHYAIQCAFNWDDDHLYSFFMSGKMWDKESEYVSPRNRESELSLMRRGGKFPPQADQTLFSELNLSPGAEFLYIFDYGDEWWHRIELLEIREADPVAKYPRIAEKHGDAPDQYSEWDNTPEMSPKEALKALGSDAALVLKIEAAIDTSYNDNLSRADLKKQYALAIELREAIHRRNSEQKTFADWLRERFLNPARRILGIPEEASEILPEKACLEKDSDAFRLFEIALDHYDLTEWLIQMPLYLADKGLVKEGAGLAMSWSDIMDAENFLGDRAIILAEAGLEQEAREQIRENLARFPEDTWIQINAGDAYRSIKDWTAAESLYRKALESSDDDYDRLDILERLIPLLREAGKTAEADSLEAEERKRREEFRSGWIQYVRQEPKIGRNAPCPCGSGKKYKKCCLGKE